jgi:hypothetical protein
VYGACPRSLAFQKIKTTSALSRQVVGTYSRITGGST